MLDAMYCFNNFGKRKNKIPAENIFDVKSMKKMIYNDKLFNSSKRKENCRRKKTLNQRKCPLTNETLCSRFGGD
jgi:hypothetical protein